jgi:hypothetical protein
MAGRKLCESDLRLRAGSHSEREDLNQTIRAECGEGFRLADWNEFFTFGGSIGGWSESPGLMEGKRISRWIPTRGTRSGWGDNAIDHSPSTIDYCQSAGARNKQKQPFTHECRVFEMVI